MTKFKDVIDSVNLWNFEKLKDNENYKKWNRYCQNALKIMSIWHVVIEILSLLSFNEKHDVKNANENIITVKKSMSKYNKDMIDWAAEIRLWHMHDRMIKNNIFNKLKNIFMKRVLNIIDIKSMWDVLKQRFTDQSYIKKHNLYI